MEKQYNRYIPKSERKDKPIEGIGDVVKVVLVKTGIEKIYKAVNPVNKDSTKPCSPCEARRRALNESKLSKLIFGDNKPNVIQND